jgi:radical SAM protein with 4Fe4S-binding SPASM domain
MNWLYDAGKLMSVKTTEGHHYKRIVIQRTILDELGVDPGPIMGLGETYEQLRAAFDQIADTSNTRYVEEDRMRRSPMHINAGNGFVFISRRGEVFPSGFMPVAGGSVKEESLVDIYRDSPLFQDLRSPDLYEGRCGMCEFRFVCGGSRSRAYAVTGSPVGEEPFCTYEPGSFPYQEELRPYLQS